MSIARPSLLLRVEGAVLLAATIALYAQADASWLMLALLFFVPDVSMVGYTKGARTGAAVYNLVHSTLIALPLAVIGYVGDVDLLLAVGLIWLAHIGFDRVLGYGLKYPEGFKQTHLARV